MIVVFPIFAFGAGLLASVVAFRTMPAILLAPAIAILAATVSVGFPAIFLGLMPPTPEFTSVVLTSLGLTFVGLAFVAFTRGEPHRPSSRPALLALGGLVPALVLGLTTTSVAHGWTTESVVPELKVAYGIAESKTHVVVPLQGECWTGLELRLAVIERATQEAWVLPVRGAWYPMFDPEGKRLLLRNHTDRGGWLVELATRKVTPLPGRSKEGFGYREVLWRESGPLVFTARTKAIGVFDPLNDSEHVLKLAEPALFVGVQPGTGRLILRDAEGLLAVTLPDDLATGQVLSPGVRLVRWSHLPHEPPSLDLAQDVKPVDPYVYAGVELSSTGRYVLCRKDDDDSTPVVYDLATSCEKPVEGKGSCLPCMCSRAIPELVRDERTSDAVAWKQSSAVGPEPNARFGSYCFAFSPDDNYLLIERAGGAVVLFDLHTSKSRVLAKRCSTYPGRRGTWSPDGRFGILPSGATVDVAASPLPNPAVNALSNPGVVAFVNSDRLLRLGDELNVEPSSETGGAQ
jgi:hypothetical protein